MWKRQVSQVESVKGKKSKVDQHIKEDILNSYRFSKSLGINLVVYARNDETDTVIMRDFAAKKFGVFGVKGEDQIEKMFRAIITLLTENREKTLAGLKYGVGEKLKDFLDNVKENEQFQILEINGKQTIAIDDKFRVNLNFHDGYVKIGLLNLQKEGDLNLVHTGIHLFL